MTQTTPPAMSVVVVTRSGFWLIRRTVRALAAQTIAAGIELLIVAPSAAHVDDRGPSELDGFARVEIIATGAPIASADQAAAHGLRAATAPVAAVCEDHAFPEPDWAAELLAAHDGPWAVVGGRLVNGNPRSLLSWTNAIGVHVPELLNPHGEQRTPITSHNASYKTTILAEYGDRLEGFLGRDGGLQRDLLGRGHRVFLTTRARYRHLQPSRLGPQIVFQYNFSRCYAATRVRQEGWGPGRRLAYVLGSPLLPVVGLARKVGPARHFGQFPRVLPSLVLVLLIAAAGEAAGYARGAGRSRATMSDLEVERTRFLNRRDLAEHAAAVA